MSDMVFWTNSNFIVIRQYVHVISKENIEIHVGLHMGNKIP